MKRGIISLIIFLVILASVSAQHVAPLDCDKLFTGEFESRTEFEELADICFYGSGFEDESVKVRLEGETDYELDAEVSNGVIGSIVGGVKNFFQDIVAGVYNMVVVERESNYEYPTNITVTGEQEEPPEEPEEPDEIPEFSTIAAIGALAGAGYYIHKRRK